MKQFGVRLNTCLLVGLFVILFILNTKEARAASGLSFACGSANGQPGAQVLIPIQANQFANINSFQFSLHWSQNDAAYVGVEQFGLAGLAGGNFGTTMTNNGTVTISWDDPNGASVSVADGTILFMLRLQLIGNLGSLSSIFIDSNPTPLEAADGNLQVVPASVSAGQLVIGQPNTPPVLAAIGNKTINEGALLSFRAAATDSDSPAQTLSFSLDAGAPAGAGIDPGTGVFTWTPTEAQGPSVNSVTIRVTDSGLPARSATQTLNITVNEVNTAPVLAAIGNKTINEGSLLSFSVSASDGDLPAQTLTYSLDTGAPAGANINANTGAFNWTPTEAQGPANVSVTIRVTDSGSPALSAAQTISIVVNEVNTAPVLTPIGNKTVNETNLLTFTVSATDADLPAQILTYSLDAGAPAGASLNPSSGVFNWTPSKGTGPSTNRVTIRVADNASPAASASETITITVNQVNTPPVLASIANKTVNEGSTLSFSASATDADIPAQTLAYSLDSGAPAGASIDPASGLFTWKPTEAQGANSYTIALRVTDNGTPNLSALRTFTVSVNEINNAPVLASIGNKTVKEGSLLSFTASATDSDLPAQTLTFSLDAGAPSGAAINPATGVFTWTPTEAQGPNTYSVTIRVTDNGSPAANASETISIRADEVNTAPVLASIGNRTINETAQLTFTASASDADIPAQALTYSLATGAPAGASIDSQTGVFAWTPTEAQGPGAYQITIRVTDNGSPTLSDSKTITVTVNELNTPPLLAAIDNKTITENSLLTFTASATDSDLPAQTLTYSLDAGAPAGAAINPATGVFTWTPTGAQGPSVNRVTIRVTDNGSPALNASQTLTITVNEVNTAPVLAHIGNKTVDEGNLLTFVATANDANVPAQVLTFTLDPGAPAGASIDPVTGLFTWTPIEAQGPSTNSVTIRVTDDGIPVANASETILITVKEVNTAPVMQSLGNKVGHAGDALSCKVLVTDADLPAQTLAFSLDAGAPAGASIDPVTGLFTWTPAVAQGPSTNRITVRVTDNGFPPLSATQVLTIAVMVDPVNTAPVLSIIGDRTINEGSLLTFIATATDADLPEQTLTYSLGAGAPAGASIDSQTGVFGWTPDEAQGPQAYPVTIRVTDNGSPAASASETITLTVKEVNSAPVLASIGNKTIDEGTLLSFTVAATDADVPAQNLSYSLDAGAPAGAGIGSVSGIFTWTPTPGRGPSTNRITIRATDDGSPALSASETITVTVHAATPAPVPGPIGNKIVNEGSLLTFNVAGMLVDLSVPNLTYSLGGAPAGAKIDPLTGVFTWIPTEAQGPGTNRVTFRATNNISPPVSASQTITITVYEVNSAPVLAAIGDKTVNEGNLLTFKVSASDPDLPAQVLSYSLAAGAPAGASINPVTGVFNWTPTEIQGPSTTAITIQVKDNGSPSLSDSETILITVNEVNVAPVLATIGNKTIAEGSLLTFQATASDADLPAQTLTYSLASGAPQGASIDPATGIFTWTPSEAQGPSSNLVTIRVTDNGSPALGASQTIAIIVNEVNTAPVLAPIGNQSISEGSLLSFTASASDSDLPAQSLTFSLGPGAPAGASINPATGVFTWTPSETQGPSSNLVTIRVTDNGTPAASASEAITIVVYEINAAPALAAISNQTVMEGSFLTFKAFASDTDLPAQNLIYTLDAGAPAGASINPTNGVFTWIPSELQGPAIYAITIIATDNGSPARSASQTFSVTVTETNSAPVLAPISSQTVSEGSLLTFKISVSDPDLPRQSLTCSLAPGAPAGAAIDPATGVFTWTPTKAQGPSSNRVTIRVTDNGSPALLASQAVSIIVYDVNTPPALMAIGNKTVNEGSLLNFKVSASDADIPVQTLRYSLGAGAPAGASINPTNGIFTWTPSEAQGPSTNLLTIRATDSGTPALTASETIAITVNEVNTAPMLAAIPAKTIAEGTLLTFKTSATDADIPMQNLTYSLDGANAPAGASIDAASGIFKWMPTEAQGPSTVTITFRVTDDGSPPLSAFRNVTITVTETNNPPVLAPIGNQTINEGSLLTFKAVASDSDLPAQNLAFSLGAGAPAGASINPATGIFTWTPSEAQGPSTNLVTVWITDNGVPAASAAQTVAIVVNEVNTAPVLAPIGIKTVSEGSLLTFKASATDADLPAQKLTYSLDAGPAPAGAAINPTSGVFTWTPSEDQGPRSYAITIRVTDNGSPALSSSQTVTIIVNEVNAAPVLAAIGNKTVNEGELLTFTISATDSDLPMQLLTYSLGPGAPSGATVDPVSGIFTWTPSEAQGPSTNRVTIRVTDNGVPALSASQAFSIIVKEINNPPVLMAIGNKTIDEGSLLTFKVFASDPDIPAQSLRYSLGLGAPAGASINPTNGIFSWRPTEAQGPNTNLLTIRVTDSGSPSLTASETIAITVNEVNTAPVLAPVGNKTIAEGSLLTFKVSATDVDLPAQNLTYSLDEGSKPAGASIDSATGVFKWIPTEVQGPSTVFITIRVTDDGSPAFTVFQNIAITVTETNTAPILESIGDKTVTEGSLLTFTAAASDADVPAQTLTYSLLGGAPVGASINPTTGLFAWPAALAAPSTNAVTIRVTDNGTPSLSATQRFNILTLPSEVSPLSASTTQPTSSQFNPLSAMATMPANAAQANQTTRSLANPERMLVVGNAPILEALPSANHLPVLVLYGLPGISCVLESTSDEGPSKQWQTVWQGTMTNISQVIRPSGAPANGVTLFRAFRKP